MDDDSPEQLHRGHDERHIFVRVFASGAHIELCDWSIFGGSILLRRARRGHLRRRDHAATSVRRRRGRYLRARRVRWARARSIGRG